MDYLRIRRNYLALVLMTITAVSLGCEPVAGPADPNRVRDLAKEANELALSGSIPKSIKKLEKGLSILHSFQRAQRDQCYEVNCMNVLMMGIDNARIPGGEKADLYKKILSVISNYESVIIKFHLFESYVRHFNSMMKPSEPEFEVSEEMLSTLYSQALKIAKSFEELERRGEALRDIVSGLVKTDLSEKTKRELLKATIPLLLETDTFATQRALRRVGNVIFSQHLNAWADLSTFRRTNGKTSIVGKIIPIYIDPERGNEISSIYGDLPSELRAMKPEEVGTIVLLKRPLHLAEGEYRTGGSTYGNYGGKALRVTRSIIIIHRKDREIVEEKTFRGGPPPSKILFSKGDRKIHRGSDPIDEIVVYLKSLPRKKFDVVVSESSSQ